MYKDSDTRVSYQYLLLLIWKIFTCKYYTYVCVWDEWDTYKYLRVNNLNIYTDVCPKGVPMRVRYANRIKNYIFWIFVLVAQSLNRSQKHGKR